MIILRIIFLALLLAVHGCAKNQEDQSDSEVSANGEVKPIDHFFLSNSALLTYTPSGISQNGVFELKGNVARCLEEILCQFQKAGLLKNLKSVHDFYYKVDGHILSHKSITVSFKDMVTDIRGLIINTQNNEAIVAFRGTNNLRNMIANLSGTHLSHFKSNEQAINIDTKNLPASKSFFKRIVAYKLNRGRVNIHTGFYLSFDSFWKNFLHPKLADQSLFPSGNKLYLTGHSLGGAYATLMGSFLAANRGSNRHTSDLYSNIHEIVNFGPPRIGDRNMLLWYLDEAKLYNKTIIYKNRLDVVPLLGIFSQGYRHIGRIKEFEANISDSMSLQDRIARIEAKDLDSNVQSNKTYKAFRAASRKAWAHEKVDYITDQMSSTVSNLKGLFAPGENLHLTDAAALESLTDHATLKEFFEEYSMAEDSLALTICAHTMGEVPEDTPCGFLETKGIVANEKDHFFSYLRRTGVAK